MITSDEKFSKNKFIGRHKERELFKRLLNKKESRQALYIEADGGVGKTKLLQQLIETCIEEKWNLGREIKSQNEILIDFYTLENRNILGLRKNIINRIGKEFFPEYLAKNNEMEKEQEGKVAIILSEMRTVFLRELNAINLEKIGPTALFFDTFELGYSSYEIRNWFLGTFIPNANKLGIMITFAGRKLDSDISTTDICKQVLENFNLEEYKEYFKDYAYKLATNEEILFELSKGKPLIVELMDSINWEDFSNYIREKARDNYEEFLGLLISRFINNSYEDQLIKIIKEMAYLKRGYTDEIFNVRKEDYPNIKSWEELKSSLQTKYPFVKYYPSRNSLVLHDELQKMIEHHGRGVFTDTASKLRVKIVGDWYEKKIKETLDADIKNLLQVEQLAYLLDENGKPDDKVLDSKLAKEKLLKFNEYNSHLLSSFIVSEISVDAANRFLPEDQDEVLGLLGKMARRIYQYEVSASYWSAVLVKAVKTNNYKRQVEASISLHNVTWRNNPSQTFDVLEDALKISQNHEDAKKLIPRVLNAIAFNYARFQSHEKAIEYYEKALTFIPEGEFINLKPKIFNNLGDAYLEIGNMDKAKAYIDSSLRIKRKNLGLINTDDVKEIRNTEISIGASFVILGKAERYLNNLIEAESAYSEAISIFEKYNDQPSLADALLERGEMYRRIARLNFEKNPLNNISFYEEKAKSDIQAGFELCQYNNSLNLIGRAHRRKGRFLHDLGYRSADFEKKLEYYKNALEEFEQARDIAIRVKDVREELENLREIAFFADDMADITIQNSQNKLQTERELKHLETYIDQFERGLKSHENDLYRLYNYDAFRALLTLEKAAFAYATGRKDDALNLYIPAFVNLAKLPGYGVANYRSYLPHLFNNIHKLNDHNLERVWCGTIKNVWIKEQLDKTRKEMIDNIEVYLIEIGER